VLAYLVSVGLIGLLIFAATVGRTMVDVIRVQLWAVGATGAALASMLVLVVVNGMTSDILAEPHTGFAVLYLVAAVALARLHAPARRGPSYALDADADAVVALGDVASGSGP
jgi:hypothetical protein